LKSLYIYFRSNQYVDKVGRFETFPLPTLVAKTQTHGRKKTEIKASGCVVPRLLIGTSEMSLGKLGFALSA
jgi:hypothetical protein